MTDKPGDEIPQDVMEIAEAVCAIELVPEGEVRTRRAIARAIMAERHRCLEHCDYIIQNIDVQSKRRSRFDIYDLGRAYRDGAKHVKERIDGSYKEKWKPPAEEVNPLPVFGEKVAKS